MFNEITEKAILKAFEEPRELDMKRVNAQQAPPLIPDSPVPFVCFCVSVFYSNRFRGLPSRGADGCVWAVLDSSGLEWTQMGKKGRKPAKGGRRFYRNLYNIE